MLILSWGAHISCKSGPVRLSHVRMKRITRSISTERAGISWIALPRYNYSVVCLSLWSVALITSYRTGQGMAGPVSVYASLPCQGSETLRPAAFKAVTRAYRFSNSRRRRRGNSREIGVRHAPHRLLHACLLHVFSDYHILLEVDQIF